MTTKTEDCKTESIEVEYERLFEYRLRHKKNKIYIIIMMIIVLLKLLFRELNKPAPGVISGGLTYNGAPVVNATVTAYNTAGDEVAVTTSDSNGAYTLPPLTLGQYHITAILRNSDGTWLQADSDVDLESLTLVVDLTLE